MINSTVLDELKRLEQENELLRPVDVVDAARSLSSPLHDYFEWDDTVAGQKYRIEQARRLIRVSVEFLNPNNKNIPVRAYMSLSTDRIKPGGGYRSTAKVLTHKALRELMIRDSIAMFDAFQRRFGILTELAEVFEAFEKARKKLLAKKKTSRSKGSRRSVSDAI